MSFDSEIDKEHLIEAWVDHLESPFWVKRSSSPKCFGCNIDLKKDLTTMKSCGCHCRLCGKIYCFQCTHLRFLPSRFEKKMKTKETIQQYPVRVCNSCVRQVLSRRSAILQDISRKEGKLEHDFVDIAVISSNNSQALHLFTGIANDVPVTTLYAQFTNLHPELSNVHFIFNGQNLRVEHMSSFTARQLAPIVYVRDGNSQPATPTNVTSTVTASTLPPTNIFIEENVARASPKGASFNPNAFHSVSNISSKERENDNLKDKENDKTNDDISTDENPKFGSPRLKASNHQLQVEASPAHDPRRLNVDTTSQTEPSPSPKNSSPQSNVAPTPSNKSNKQRTSFWVEAIYSYKNKKEGKYLSFQKGEVMRITKPGEQWLWAIKDKEQKGWIPSSYVKRVEPNESK